MKSLFCSFEVETIYTLCDLGYNRGRYNRWIGAIICDEDMVIVWANRHNQRRKGKNNQGNYERDIEMETDCEKLVITCN